MDTPALCATPAASGMTHLGGARYIFVKEPDPANPYDRTKVGIRVTTHSKDNVIMVFQEFLLACGFTLNGTIADVEDYENEPQDC